MSAAIADVAITTNVPSVPIAVTHSGDIGRYFLRVFRPNIGMRHSLHVRWIRALRVRVIESFAENGEILEVFPERGRVASYAQIPDERFYGPPITQNDAAPEAASDRGVDDPVFDQHAF